MSEGIKNFTEFELAPPLLKVLIELGYETPTPIQAQTIPHLIDGKDMLGQAQTGTGKTAAFALPLLTRLDLKNNKPQALILTPTRELAIQVAEAFQRYASNFKNFHVLPIYGGASMHGQLRQLKRGVHVVVGTPGRVMDHLRRKTLRLDNLSTLVLDEADEMLRMGFIDDVEWILEQAPTKRQTALFSATMPKEIRKIAKNHLVNPEEITIKVKTSTADTINQSYCLASGMPHKIDVLTRILEVENFEAVLIFVRTKTATVELSEKLQARGHACAALNGDIAQNQRERIVERLKKGELDILVATDVAARGLDIKRASHVINFDIPYDVESYIHRIGRTGRAGKKGDAILFVAPRERRMLRTIETATRQKIAEMKLPHKKEIKQLRIVQFKERISKAITQDELKFFAELIEQYQQETDTPLTTIAAALAQIAEEKAPLFTQIKEVQTLADKPKSGRQGRRQENGSRRAQKPAKFFGKHGKKKSFSKAKPGKASNKSTRAKRSSNTKRSR